MALFYPIYTYLFFFVQFNKWLNNKGRYSQFLSLNERPLEQDHLKQIYNGNLNEQQRYILSLHSTTSTPLGTFKLKNNNTTTFQCVCAVETQQLFRNKD